MLPDVLIKLAKAPEFHIVRNLVVEIIFICLCNLMCVGEADGEDDLENYYCGT